jgi:hypothetical protein
MMLSIAARVIQRLTNEFYFAYSDSSFHRAAGHHDMSFKNCLQAMHLRFRSFGSDEQQAAII